jgi:pilus assembly protein CpaB
MNRRNRTLVVLLVAVAIASVATFMVYRAIDRIPEKIVEVHSVEYVVAASDLPMGTRLGPEHLKVMPWPSAGQVEGTFQHADALIGRGLIQSVRSNELITEGRLAPVDAGSGFNTIIPEGMRALSVRVNDVTGIAGYTTPGTRIDMLVTMRDGEASRAKVFVSNVQVLTSGTVYDQDQGKNGQPIPATVVTLMVTPEQSELITLAQNSGAITLTLRNPLDMKPTETDGAVVAQLMGRTAPSRPAEAPVRRAVRPRTTPDAPPVPAVYRIETIKAGKVSDEVIK